MPYAGGWQNQPDPTGGKAVSTLAPDRPPTVELQDLARYLCAAVQFRESGRQIRGERVGGRHAVLERSLDRDECGAGCRRGRRAWRLAARREPQTADSLEALAARAVALEHDSRLARGFKRRSRSCSASMASTPTSRSGVRRRICSRPMARSRSVVAAFTWAVTTFARSCARMAPRCRRLAGCSTRCSCSR